MANDSSSVGTEEATPEQAFLVAEQRIADAAASGATELKLSGGSDEVALSSLTALPPTIGDLPTVRKVLLGDTKVSDLRLLARMSGLEQLQIFRTPVEELGPLVDLKSL